MEAEISGQNGNLCDGPGTWCEIQQQSAGIKKPSESFAVCKGRVFAYLDGDDFYIDDHKLQKQVEIMDQPENAKYAVCAHNVYAYDEKTKEDTPF